MFQKYFMVCGNVRSCYKRFVVRQMVKIPAVLVERGIPYQKDPLPSSISIDFLASCVESREYRDS